MVNSDDITKENITKYNLNQPQIFVYGLNNIK